MKILRFVSVFFGLVLVSGGLAAGAASLVPVRETWEYESLLFIFCVLFFFAAVGWIATVRRVLKRLAVDGWKKYVTAAGYYLLWCGFFFFVLASLFAE